MKHVVKRKGHKQEFDERKVYASVFAACLASHTPHEDAEKVANDVSKKINEWISDKDEVTSNQIFAKVGNLLEEINRDAAFMYTTHRDIS